MLLERFRRPPRASSVRAAPPTVPMSALTGERRPGDVVGEEGVSDPRGWSVGLDGTTNYLTASRCGRSGGPWCRRRRRRVHHPSCETHRRVSQRDADRGLGLRRSPHWSAPASRTPQRCARRPAALTQILPQRTPPCRVGGDLAWVLRGRLTATTSWHAPLTGAGVFWCPRRAASSAAGAGGGRGAGGRARGSHRPRGIRALH